MKKTIFISLIATLFLATVLPIYQGKAAIPATIEAFGQILQIQNWPSIFKIDITNKDADNNVKIKSQGIVDVNIVNYPLAPKTVWVWQNAAGLHNGDYSPVFEANGWNKMYFDVRQTNPSSCGYNLKLLSSLDGNNWLPQNVYIYIDRNISSGDQIIGTYRSYENGIPDATSDYWLGNSERLESFVKAPYYRFEFNGNSSGNCSNEVLNAYVYLTPAINSLEY